MEILLLGISNKWINWETDRSRRYQQWNLENFLDEKKKYEKEKIREFALKNFSKDEVGKMIFNIYQDVLGK